MLILPDFGRDSDMNPAGNGFQHHRTGDAASRTTWMMALGQGAREGVFIERPVESTDLVPTVGKLLGVDTPVSTGRILSEVV
jgi:arylsulfatase A-like enzyme